MFQEKYFANTFDPEFGVTPQAELQNAPHLVTLPSGVMAPAPGKTLGAEDFERFVEFSSAYIAELLGLQRT
jgi:hypothetical protein